MIKRLILIVTLVAGMSTLLSQPAGACDVATIEKPEPYQTLYFEPIEILVQFKEGANPGTFKAWLNSRRITDRFEPVASGMRALIGPEDGLRIYEKGERFFRGLNLLITSTRNESGKKDLDLRVFKANKGGDQNTVIVTMLQTSDLHHHASGYGPFLDYTPLDTSDNDIITGGYARIATLVKQIREEQADYDIPVMLLDSGDFLMGTYYDLTASDPIAFRFFSMLGYDAITLGNHEFDWSPAGLAMLFANAVGQGFNIPVLATNTITDGTNPADNGIEYLMTTGAIVDKKIIELSNGLKVGLLGQMGPDSDTAAPVAPPITFNHDYPFIQNYVDELRTYDEAQLVVVLSHGGIYNDGMGDDADLADNVSGIDIIASGHYHTATHEPFNRSGTIIFSPGAYGAYLSRLDIAYNLSEDSIVDSKFTLIPVDDAIPGDPYVQGMVDLYQNGINTSLAPLGFTLGSHISKTSFSLEMIPFQETGLGNLTGDANRTIASLLALGSDETEPFAFSVVVNGVIRDHLYPGNTGFITFADNYNVLPLGISPDTSQPLPGYPLMSVYLTAPEIRNVCEAGLTLSPVLGPDAFLNYAGIRVDYDITQAPMLQGVTEVRLCGDTLPDVYGGDEDIFSTSCTTALNLSDFVTLYRCVVDLYALQVMHVITDVSGGALPIIPKHADGNPIDLSDPTDYMQCRIDAEPSSPEVQELKEWMALLYFLEDVFPATGDGIDEEIYGPGGAAMGRVNFVD